MTDKSTRCDVPEKRIVKAFKFDKHSKKLRVLDQTLLPKDLKYVDIADSEAGRTAIKSMIVRGAPCIAAVGCLSIIAELNAIKEEKTTVDIINLLEEKSQRFANARPTAVNLKNTLVKLNEHAKKFAANAKSGKEVIIQLTNLCLSAIEDGKALNMRLGDIGATELMSKSLVDPQDNRINVITHCNTGSLATVGYGTALGVIRSLHQRGLLKQVYCTETRPYNQGSRLTAWELEKEDIPGTLIADSMVAFLMEKRKIDAVIVGADCVAANGDTANKIGTLQLAVVSKHYNVPFFVASPTQTFDIGKESRSDMQIEERPGKELKRIGDICLAPDTMTAWNPGFDITPPELITAIITEAGICDPKNVRDFLAKLPKNEDNLIF